MEHQRYCPRCCEPIGLSCPRCDVQTPDAVTKGNALAQAIRERDELRETNSRLNRIIQATAQFGLLPTDRIDDLPGAVEQSTRERDELRKRVAELEERPHLAGTCPSCEIGLVTDAGYELVAQRDAAWAERDAIRAQVTRWSNELADALGCVNEHGVAPAFAEMVEKVRRMQKRVAEREAERDVAIANRELAEDEAKQLRCERDEARRQIARLEFAIGEDSLPTLRDQVAMHVLQGLLAAVQFNPDQGSPYAPITAVSDAIAIADAFLEERSK